MPGPVPKRSDQRRRRNKPDGAPLAKGAAGKRPARPEPDDGWHPIAVAWFLSLGESGQAQFYEASDWQTARYVAEAMSRNLAANGRFSGQLFQAVMSAMTELLTTEGARRRARIELERGETPVPASITALERYRRAAGGRPEGEEGGCGED